jgi:hypothetical protein
VARHAQRKSRPGATLAQIGEPVPFKMAVYHLILARSHSNEPLIVLLPVAKAAHLPRSKFGNASISLVRYRAVVIHSLNVYRCITAAVNVD